MRKKILIVEDETDLLEIVRLAFNSERFLVATARNGLEALKKAHTNIPDLIVLDLVLPELDGFAVCETLRAERATATVPIIVVTGLASEFTRLAGFEAGANDYVTKPFTPSDLVSKVDYWLSATEQAQPAPAGVVELKVADPATCP